MMRGNGPTVWGLALAGFVLFSHPRLLIAGQPMEEIKIAIEQVSEVLQDVSAKSGANQAEAIQKIREILLPKFDFAEMAKRSLGDQWANLNGKQDEFVAAFAEFVENSYMNTLASYRGEKISYLGERVNQNLAQVDTRIVSANGDALAVVYRLHFVEGVWRIYDVGIDNIGLVSNFRSQFHRILAGATIDDLMKKLRQKGFDKPV